MHYDEDVNGTALDSRYVPDELDEIPAHASAAGMIYSFYGRLSVGNMDPAWLAEGNLPPTFYVYGTEDPFYRQFQQQYDVISNMGISTGRIVLMSLHLGLHGNMLLGIVRKYSGSHPVCTRVLRAAGLLFAAYGLIAFVRRNISDYLFLKSHFVFYDFSQPAALFMLDYLAIMSLFALAGYWLVRGLGKFSAQ